MGPCAVPCGHWTALYWTVAALVFVIGIWAVRTERGEAGYETRHWTARTDPVAVPIMALCWPLGAFMLCLGAIVAVIQWFMGLLTTVRREAT